MVLQTLKEAASAYLGCEVRDAVVTVPAYFNNSQRQATIDAAAIAGLNVLRIVNEPTAGALAYGIGSKDDDVERNVLIFDFGGGTFDVSVLTIDCGIFEVKSTAGNTHLGGSDLDSRLVDHFADRFKQLHKRSLRGSPKAMRRLRTACERVKRRLSTATEASAELHALDGVDFQVKLTRARFDDLCADLFKATLDTVREALGGARFEKGEIHDVVLVGGSTRIPAVRKLLQDFFDGITLKHTVHPDEAVAAGAAIQADMQTNNETGLDILDVTPLSLGTDLKGGLTAVIIPRNTIIPARKTDRHCTCDDNQTEIVIRIVEGERAMFKDNHLLGKFTLSGITPAPAEEVDIDITFDLDHNGILKVTAVEVGNEGNANSLTVTNYEGRLTEDRIKELIREAESFKEEDQLRKETAQARVALEKFCLDTKKRLRDMENMDPSNRKKALEKVNEALQWTESADNASKADLERKQREIDLAVDMMVTL